MDMENKNELILWVIIGIIIALFVLFMPDLERLIFGRAKKDKLDKTTVEQDAILKTGNLICGTTTDNESIEYVVYYENSEAIKEKMTVSKLFAKDKDVTDSIKNECNKVSTKYENQAGFKASCKISGLSMTTVYQIDLKNYKGFTITNDDGTTETFKKEIKYKQDIDEVAKYFKKNNATCK